MRRAFTVIVVAPNHLIGSQEQVTAFHAGHARELPPWFGEWHDLLPHWRLRILESPTDVGAFFRSAAHDVETPHVGFIATSKLSLSCGVELGAQDRAFSPWSLRHADLFAHDDVVEQKALEALRDTRKAAARAQAAVSAAAPDENDVETVYAVGTSLRTTHRDSLLRTKYRRLQNGLCCPQCGRRMLTKKLEPATPEQLKKSGLAKAVCEWCGERFGQLARERDNVFDREAALFKSASWRNDFACDADGTRLIPWGERPLSNPRYALGPLIRRRYAGRVDLFMADEIHKAKAANSAIGHAVGAMVTASRFTVALTGTLFGGYASDVYSLLLRLGNPAVLDRWGWGDEPRFVREAGVVEEITREVQRVSDAGHFSGEPKVSTEIRERPGITATLAEIIQSQAVQVNLGHMGFNLVPYSEDLVTLSMPSDIAREYRALEAEAKAMLAARAHDALASYLQSSLSYPYQPWNPKTVGSRLKEMAYTPDGCDPTRVLPHHTWLAEYCADQIRGGRRVLIYAEHTGRDDLMPDVAAKITRIAAEEHGATLKVGMLRSTTVEAGARRAWFAEREADGTNVVVCNPRLVETGLNLIQWPSIVVLEPVYSLYTLFQAKRRAFRPTQTRPCDVVYVAYADTMSERAIGIIARKAAAAAILSGDDLDSGLMEFDAGMSLLQELAKAVTSGADAMNTDIRSMLVDGAAAFHASMTGGAAGLLGALEVAPDLEDGTAIAVAAPVSAPARPASRISIWDLFAAQQRATAATRKTRVVRPRLTSQQPTLFDVT